MSSIREARGRSTASERTRTIHNRARETQMRRSVGRRRLMSRVVGRRVACHLQQVATASSLLDCARPWLWWRSPMADYANSDYTHHPLATHKALESRIGSRPADNTAGSDSHETLWRRMVALARRRMSLFIQLIGHQHPASNTNLWWPFDHGEQFMLMPAQHTSARPQAAAE
jgi:hypothetical protein